MSQDRVNQLVKKEQRNLNYEMRLSILLQPVNTQTTTVTLLPPKNRSSHTKKLEHFEEISVNIDRAGCILRYPIDEHRFEYVLNRSNYDYLSDFGGGVRDKETWKEGLTRELLEECPWMYEDIIELLFKKESTYSIFLQTTKGEKNNRLLILIDVPEKPSFLTEFHPTKDVKELVLLSSEQLLRAFMFTSGINYGILQLKKIYRQGLYTI